MVILLWLLLSFVYSALSGWAFMIAVGVAHAEWVPSLPTIGFWPAFIIAMLLGSALRLGSLDFSSDK